MLKRMIFMLVLIIFGFNVQAQDIPIGQPGAPGGFGEWFKEYSAPAKIIPLTEEDKALPRLRVGIPTYLSEMPLEGDAKYVDIVVGLGKKRKLRVNLSGKFVIEKEDALKADPCIIEKWFNRNLFYHIEYKIKFNPKIINKAKRTLKKVKKRYLEGIQREIDEAVRAGLMKWDEKEKKYKAPSPEIEQMAKEARMRGESINPPWEIANEALKGVLKETRKLNKVDLGGIGIHINGENAIGTEFIYYVKENKIKVFNFLKSEVIEEMERVSEEPKELVYKGVFENASRVRVIGRNIFDIYLQDREDIGELEIDPDNSYFMLLPREEAEKFGTGVPTVPTEGLIHIDERID